MKYLNGVILRQLIDGVSTLVIHISSDDTGHSLSANFSIILEAYKKYIECICMAGNNLQQQDLTEYFKVAEKEGLKTAILSDSITDTNQITQRLIEVLDYAILNNRVYTKDYSPFGDCYDWI